METVKNVFGMKLHETMTVKQQNSAIEIIRVPGGWIYKIPKVNTTKAVFVKTTKDVPAERLAMVDQGIYEMQLHDTFRVKNDSDTLDVTKVPGGWLYHLEDIIENNLLFVEFDDEFLAPAIDVADESKVHKLY